MDDPCRSRRHSSEGVNVGHNIMTTSLFLDPCDLKVGIGHCEMLPHLPEGFRRDSLNAELLFALCQDQPQLAPLRVAGTLAEEVGHLWAAIPSRQRGLVGIEGRRPRLAFATSKLGFSTVRHCVVGCLGCGLNC